MGNCICYLSRIAIEWKSIYNLWAIIRDWCSTQPFIPLWEGWGQMCDCTRMLLILSLIPSSLHYISWALGYFVDKRTILLLLAAPLHSVHIFCFSSIHLSLCSYNPNYIILTATHINHPWEKDSREVYSTQVKKMYKNTLNLFITKIPFLLPPFTLAYILYTFAMFYFTRLSIYVYQTI